MITLDQIRALEARVEKAVSLIDRMKSERSGLIEKIGAYERRIGELEAFIESVRKDQARIEEGISNALLKLDAVEDFMLLKADAAQKNEPELAEESSIAPVSSRETPASDMAVEPEPDEAVAATADDTSPESRPSDNATIDTRAAEDSPGDELDIF